MEKICINDSVSNNNACKPSYFDTFSSIVVLLDDVAQPRQEHEIPDIPFNRGTQTN